MRLIDVDTLEREIMAMTDDELCEDCCYNVVNKLSAAPTIDAVPVVRCKDCKFIEHVIDCKGKHCYCCYNSDSPVDNDCPIDADWYCADGERREDDAKAST